MKKLLIVLTVLTVVFNVSAKTKQVAKHTFVNKDATIKVGVDTTLAVRNLDKPVIPLKLFVACQKNASAHLDRNSFILVYKGKEYKMPAFTYVKKAYKSDIKDRRVFSLADSHIYAAMDSKHSFKTVQFFPNRQYRGLIENAAYVNFKTGMDSILFFENPGFKKGDTIILKVVDKTNKQIQGSVRLTL